MRRFTSILRIASFALPALILVHLAWPVTLKQPAHAQQPSSYSPHSEATQTKTAAANLPVSTQVQTSVSAQPTKACVPEAAPSLRPLRYSQLVPGINIVNETPKYYDVFGDDTSQLRNQIQGCGPIAEGRSRYAAVTAYVLDWDFDYVMVPQNPTECTLSNVAVGIHTQQTLPRLQTSDPNLDTAWQRFITNLKTHEDGHTAIAAMYGQIVLENLQILPAESCATIGSTAEHTANQIINALIAAQDLYDTQTVHGAKQGTNL